VSLAGLGIGYIAIGGVIAAVVAGVKRRLSVGDAVLIVGLWPLYAPLSFARADTRIPPGEATVFARAWTAGRTAEATAARVTVEVHPDEFYERFYAEKLAGTLAPAQRALYEQAAARARGSHYVAEQRDVPIQP
jgi:hypothetical protein